MLQRIRLMQADPDLAEAVPEDDRAAAGHLLLADRHVLGRGPWRPDLTCRDGQQGSALLVLGGLLLREVVLADRRAAQVLGPGDVLRPAAAGESSLGETVEWTVMEPAEVAVLDGTFAAAAKRWPGLAAVVGDRLFAQADRSAVVLAISQLPRIEQRVLSMLWHLADRFGRVTSAGVVVPFSLTHETVGRLVGARRPTVSLGLTTLHEAGWVTRRPDGSWLLDQSSLAMLDMPEGGPQDAPTLRLVAGTGVSAAPSRSLS